MNSFELSSLRNPGTNYPDKALIVSMLRRMTSREILGFTMAVAYCFSIVFSAAVLHAESECTASSLE